MIDTMAMNTPEKGKTMSRKTIIILIAAVLSIAVVATGQTKSTSKAPTSTLTLTCTSLAESMSRAHETAPTTCHQAANSVSFTKTVHIGIGAAGSTGVVNYDATESDGTIHVSCVGSMELHSVMYGATRIACPR